MESDIRAWAKLWNDVSDDTPIGIKTTAQLVWSYSGLRAALIYRLSYACKRNNIPLLHGILSRLNLTLHGFDVPAVVKIGPGLYVPHPVGTVIMAQEIGANVTLVSNITIGMRNVPIFPRIGDNVYIGAGARILGNLDIGDNVNIGANAVVLIDVPSGATAVGVPAKVKIAVPTT
jgi:serine O-acetyltransferase